MRQYGSSTVTPFPCSNKWHVFITGRGWSWLSQGKWLVLTMATFDKDFLDYCTYLDLLK